MKKFFVVVLVFFVAFASQAVSAATHKTPLCNDPLYAVEGRLHHYAHFEYDDKIVLWGHDEFKDKSGDTHVRIYFGTAAEKARKSKDNFIGLQIYGDKYQERIECAYIALLNVADDPNKEQRVHNVNIAFSLLCRTIGMNTKERYELWNQLSNYDSSTDHNFSKNGKMFYQHCPSIKGDVYLAVNTLYDRTGLLFLLGRVTD